MQRNSKRKTIDKEMDKLRYGNQKNGRISKEIVRYSLLLKMVLGIKGRSSYFSFIFFILVNSHVIVESHPGQDVSAVSARCFV